LDERGDIAEPRNFMSASVNTGMPPGPDDGAAMRWGMYGLVIALSIGAMTGRIASANVHWPFGYNDCSRWDTARALVERGTYAIDDFVDQPGWFTMDMVQHRGSDGQLHRYSSKPPLMATLVAGEYWLIHHFGGGSLREHPFAIGALILITFNVVPLAIYFLLLARLMEQFGRTDWGRLYVMAAATFGTFPTTFATSLNNHVPAAVTALAAVYAVTRIWYHGRREPRYFAFAGLCAALTVTDDLPALSFFAALSLGLLWKAPRQTFAGYLPAVLVVAAAFFGTNYLAHGDLRPPYMHRGDQGTDDDWYHFKYVRQSDGKTEESYWSHPSKLDQGEPSVAWYAFNVLVGHHGIFSLTPIWLLAIPGVFWLARRAEYRLRALAWLIGGVTVVCLEFYLFFVRQSDRNYGGVTCGFRWVIWMAPLWLLAILPAADWLSATRDRRVVGYVLLALSVFSASYAVWSPWIHPWLTEVFLTLGWERF
jgi:hypothetical protein